jgi:dihydroxy-acid dehydratase
VIKPAAMEAQLRRHTGPALVFCNYDDLAARIDDPDLPVTRDSVIVLQSAGPQGAPGMPEWGQLPIPQKLLKQGVRDMVRISDARMSGTSYGACVLHVTPESHVGGPLALVRDGDLITLDIDARRIDMQVGDEELARRRAEWKKPVPKFSRGYGVLYLQHVQQADSGCDFDFLAPDYREDAGATPTEGEPEIH